MAEDVEFSKELDEGVPSAFGESVRKPDLSRRRVIGGLALAGLGGLGIMAKAADAAAQDGPAPSGAKSIRQEIDFKAAPARVYEALLDEKQFSAFSGGTAQIAREVGGEFKLFGGVAGLKGIAGRNVELIPGTRIVQAWRANFWAPGTYSIVRMELTAYGPGTRLTLDQASFDAIPTTAAWSRMYWEPLQKFLDA